MRRPVSVREMALATIWGACAFVGLFFGLYAWVVLDAGQAERPLLMLASGFVFCRGAAEFVRLGWPDPPDKN